MSSRSQSDNKTPTIASTGVPPAVVKTPGLSRYVTSPETQSPEVAPMPIGSPGIISPPITNMTSTQASLRSDSMSAAPTMSPASSLVPTPESQKGKEKETPSRPVSTDRQMMSEQALAMHSALRRTQSDNSGISVGSDQAHPATYSIVVICPAEHARYSIKQHIEHVVPLQIPTAVTTLADIGAFLELFNGPQQPTFTHIVLDIPASSDVMLFMRQIATNPASQQVPALIIVTDHYQKRDIQEDFASLTSAGRKAYLIHKPVKPSVFAMIFDPALSRNLSKDRAREVAQTSRDDFRNTALSVKEAIGNKGHRVLLVEDSDVNRKVIWKYLQKVGLENDEARDGQQCVDMVKGKPLGYYSLIICDIQMPRKNGYQACEEIRAWEVAEHAAAVTAAAAGGGVTSPMSPSTAAAGGVQHVPIMALTANAMPEERQKAADSGFTDYLTKPVEYNVLGAMMVRLLGESQGVGVGVGLPGGKGTGLGSGAARVVRRGGGGHVFLRDRPLEG